MASTRGSPDSQHPSGGVELREDLPLKSRGGAAPAQCCAGGPRLILAGFATLTAAITLALLTQIYYGDYELVPHGSVSSSAAACSRAGTDALKAGGRALDAAAAAALCLAVLAPHRTSLDASGAMLYWEYRDAHTQPPLLFEWGAAGSAGAELGAADAVPERPPRLVVALATLHAQFGALPWARLLAPAIQLAKDGYMVSEGLSAALAAAGGEPPLANSLATEPALAQYLTTLLTNTSAELSSAWGGAAVVRRSVVRAQRAGAWRVLAGGAGGAGGTGGTEGAAGAGSVGSAGTAEGAAVAARALAAALEPSPSSPDDAQRRVVSFLQSEARSGGWAAAGAGVASGLAAVDRRDTYVALVTGLSEAFGSGPAAPAGWRRDRPRAPLDLAPAILLDQYVCGTRYVLGAESSSALAQGAAALATEGGAGAVERARVAVLAGGALAAEARRPPPPPAALPPAPAPPLAPAPAPPLAPAPAPPLAPAPAPPNASLPYAAVNLVQQRADALASHADSRGGGLASRF